MLKNLIIDWKLQANKLILLICDFEFPALKCVQIILSNTVLVKSEKLVTFIFFYHKIRKLATLCIANGGANQT